MPVARIQPGPSWHCAGVPATTWRMNCGREISKPMSTDDAINLRQDRRQWLKTSATVLGASLLPLPVLPAETLQTESKPSKSDHKKMENKFYFKFLNPVH